MKRVILMTGIILLLFAAATGAFAQTEEFSFQVSMGFQGSLSFFEIGLNTPTLGGSAYMGLKARIMSSLTWATFIHQNGESVSFHPVVAAGIVTVGGYSPLMEEKYRMFGATDILIGYSFTPYDSLIYKTGNLIGKNLTFGVLGYYGIELFNAENISYLFDAGGGFKTLKGDRTNMYAIASSWLGSGIGMKSGMRFYF